MAFWGKGLRIVPFYSSISKKMWPIKFKPHSRFALPCCIFPKRKLGVFCNFPKQNTTDFYIFQKYLLRNFWYEVRHSMIKSASIVRNLSKNHTFRTIASILLYTQPLFLTNLIRSAYCFRSNMAFQKRVFTSYTAH